MTLLADVVAASREVAETSSRSRKVAILANLLRTLDPSEVAIAVGFLSGLPRQGRVGVGYSTVYGIERPPAREPSLTIHELDRAITDVQETTGSGSGARRKQILGNLLTRATDQEADFVRRLFTGELRQGALAAVVADAVAKAAGVSGETMRRALMLSGDLTRTAEIAITAGEEGLREVGLEIFRPVLPMLASTAETVADALDGFVAASVEWKLDAAAPPEGVVTFLFDLLHVDGDDLLDAPLEERAARLEATVPHLRIPAVVTCDPAEGQRVLDEALRAGHEGVVVKDAASSYSAGRRGKAWRKVKPVRTYDLVVLGAEWGHGRRRGWLSNLHLGARVTRAGGFVMVGKCFKGLTDDLLRWQTKELLERETARRGIAVLVRPELVVEIALDGVQARLKPSMSILLI